MSDKVVPMFRDMPVTKELFDTSTLLIDIEALKAIGIVKGGPDVCLEDLQEIKRLGLEHGYELPDDKRALEVISGIMAWCKEDEGETT